MIRLGVRHRFAFHLVRHATTILAFSTLVFVSATSMQAQTFTVLRQFSGPDGANPYAGLTADQAGNFYGTTEAGGNSGCESYGCGTVFKLTHSGSGWVLRTLYEFQGGSDGSVPTARVVFGPDGALYGTTEDGGETNSGLLGHGTVFRLTPPANVCGSVSCPWTKQVLYTFADGSDGGIPGPGDLIFDNSGNLYGTTQAGGIFDPSCYFGSEGCGVVYKLSRSGNSWTESVLYSFTGGNDGDTPLGGVIFDQQGNMYATAFAGGTSNNGTVFELSPSGSGWTETTLHSFGGYSDGQYPTAGLISDAAGNLYGDTSSTVNSSYKGAAFELTQTQSGWNFGLLYDFPYASGPMASFTLHNGNLYSTTTGGGTYGFGSVFELVKGSGGWTPVTLYSFMSDNDGSLPEGSVLFDSAGNIYGTAFYAGVYTDGTVWEITP